MIKNIHIVAFDVPFPANYGGVIDVFYKIKTLHKEGVKVHLHCFEYGRGEQKELLKYCASVNYYQRNMSPFWIFSKLPFIVKSRVSDKLKENLLKDNYPILFEGLHTCYLLDDLDFKDRIKVFRESNIEHEYYAHLAKAEKRIFKKLYLKIETNRLKKFEKQIKHASCSFIVSEKDWEYFKEEYPDNNHYFIPSFHSGEEVNGKEGKGKYVLYHGNLGVSENYHAAQHIIENIIGDTDIQFIIAGLNPPEFLQKLVTKYLNVSLIPNPSKEKMEELIREAHINFLYTHQATGLKLKLLNVLYQGRFCIVNDHMVWGTTLQGVCIVGKKDEELKSLIKENIEKDFSKEELKDRTKVLLDNYSNKKNFNRMMEVIDGLSE